MVSVSSPKRKPSSASVYSLSSYDSPSDSSSIASTLTSTSGTWSVPRSRQPRGSGGKTPSENNRDCPRRMGGSFRVSLRPSRHRKSSSHPNDDFEGGLEGSFARKAFTAVFLAAMMGTACITMERGVDSPYLSPIYNMYDTVSTEDLVAQSEMSARTQMDDGMAPDLPQEEDEIGEAFKRISLSERVLSKTVGAKGLRSGRIGGASEPGVDDAQSRFQEQNRTDWGPSLGEKRDPHIVAYVLPIFSCYKPSSHAANQYGAHEPNTDREFHDAALMLQASIHENSKRNPSSGSSYDYEMVGLVHVGVESCAGGRNRSEILESLGYRVETVKEPILENNIRNPFLKKHAPRNNGGQTGMREMIRLLAYKMEEYSIVVLIDMTAMMLHPVDGLYDVMLHGPKNHPWVTRHEDHIVKDTFYANGSIATMSTWPEEVDIIYTRDYATMNPSSWITGISLDFLPIRPSGSTFHRLIDVYQKTTYDSKWGWDNKGYAEYAGSMMTKGLLSYYYNEIAPNSKLELHRCVYNNMGDIPYIVGDNGKEDNCRDVKEHKEGPDGQPLPCTDCRIRPFHEIVIANFAICNVPWTCPFTEDPSKVPLLSPTIKLCRHYLDNWFRLRLKLEERHLQEKERTQRLGSFHEEVFHGYCLPGGKDGNGAYKAMEEIVAFPHGQNVAVNR